MSDQTKHLDTALLKAQKAIVSVGKDAKNDFHKYKYVSAESMMAECRAVLHDAGLVLTCEGSGGLSSLVHSVVWQPFKDSDPQMVESNTVIVNRCFRLCHPESGESRVYTFAFPAVPEKGRPIDKAVAGALTSSLSYFLRDLLQVPRGDENEMDRRHDGEEPPTGKPNGRPVKEAPPKGKGTPQDAVRGELQAWGVKVENLTAATLQAVRKFIGVERVADVAPDGWAILLDHIADAKGQNAKVDEFLAIPKPKPTPLSVVMGLAQKWSVNDHKASLTQIANIVFPNRKQGAKLTNDQYELLANYLDGLIAAQKWASCDAQRSIELFAVAKYGAIPLHESDQITNDELKSIVDYMKQHPFVDAETTAPAN